MTRARKPKTETRTSEIRVRVNASEKATFEEAAKSEMTSVSSWLRQAGAARLNERRHGTG